MRVFITALLILALTLPAFAGEKEELQCREELLKERLLRLQLQSQLMQGDFKGSQTELKQVQEELKKLEDKEEIKSNK